MHNFRELNIWKESMFLAKQIYELTKTFPESEKYGITSQINRSAVSIPSNIAEGSGRNSDGDFKRFLNIALGSAFELETQILLSIEFGFIEKQVVNSNLEKLISIQKMIRGFIKSL